MSDRKAFFFKTKLNQPLKGGPDFAVRVLEVQSRPLASKHVMDMSAGRNVA